MGPPNTSSEIKFSGANEDSEQFIFSVQLPTTSRISNIARLLGPYKQTLFYIHIPL